MEAWELPKSTHEGKSNMADKKKQPGAQEEPGADSEDTSERGPMNGEAIVRFDGVEVRAQVPLGLLREAIMCCAALGFGKAEIIRAALSRLVMDPGVQQLKESYLRRNAFQYGVSEHEVYSKVLQAYKDTARRKRLNIQPEAEDELDSR